ncbi:phage tail tube protein [Desulforamulus ruminis]|uniref:XkdM protein, phage-like element PBSX n=1 Tax=Desulforamulus ruminis (strain ATCC 23193 / DSM 2154 / NCIMB 8452 / DL) TaxID=696281 RepID=F6DLR2_DESRL|nr:phage tail tube protein [Desulforamulus ruminis]AEG61704.1 XkdM protein, phage-like element PBSX [Desulforamulus ruminis DSM 2154]
MALDASRVILGTYGQVFIDGVWQTNVNHLEAKVAVEKRELNLSGDDWVRHKKGPKKGTGTMSGFKVTSGMLQRGFNKFELVSKLADPESYGHERVRLKNVMVDELQLANWTSGEEVKEEIPFTFEGYELLDPIVED